MAEMMRNDIESAAPLAGHDDEPLFAPPATQDRGSGFPRLTCAGFALLTFNSCMAIYRSEGDYQAIAFVGFSYVTLVLLFRYLRFMEERAGDPHTNSRRVRIRIAVWTLTALLGVMLCYKVATVMPLPMAAVVWAMAAAGLVGGFYAFFASPARYRIQ